MTPELQSTLKSLADEARKNLERDGHLLPVAIVVGDKPTIIGCPWRNDAEKEAGLICIRGVARENNAHLVVILAEAWTAHVGPIKDWDGVPARNQPNRKEAVVFHAETRDGSWFGQAPIIRDWKGKPTFGEVHFEPFGERDPRERFQKLLA